MKKFPCTGCGGCCRLASAMRLVPVNEEGICEHLRDDNKCAVYNNRPPNCRVDIMFKKHKKDGTIQKKSSRLDYYRKVREVCNKIMDDYNIPQEKRIEPF